MRDNKSTSEEDTLNQILEKYLEGKIEEKQFLQEIKFFFENSGDNDHKFDLINQIEILKPADIIFIFLEWILLEWEEEQAKLKSIELIVKKYLNKALYKMLDLFSKLFQAGSSELLYHLYKNLEKTESEDAQEILRIMEDCVGERYLKKYDLISKEALGLELLRRRIKELYHYPYLKGFDFSCIEVENKQISRIENDLPLGPPIDSKFFSFFPKLKFLKLQECFLTDYSLLQNLEILKINGFEIQGVEQIKDLKGLESLSNLKVLDLSKNFIKVIEGLDSLKNLIKLDLSDNDIEEISGLENLAKLEYLDLSVNGIKEIKNLEAQKNLKYLDLSENVYLSEIKGLNQLKNLEELHLDCNPLLNEIKGLDQLINLKKLGFYKNGFALMGVEFWMNFQKTIFNGFLNTSKSPEERINSLENLQDNYIKETDKNRHYIKEIKNLDHLKNLEELDLRGNDIEEIKGLDNLTNLKKLQLDNNQIKELKNLQNLTKLEFLSLSNNEIPPIKEFRYLNNSQSGVEDPQAIIQYCRIKAENED